MYKCIFDELRNSFYSLRTEARWKNISAWEVMINRAITITIRRKKAKVIKFLDEALVEKNPLAVFTPLQKFSENSEFVKYQYKYSDPIFSVTEEKLVKKIVLEELGRIKASSLGNLPLKLCLSHAALIDFFVLIIQHFISLRYRLTLEGFVTSLRIIFVTVRLSKLSFDTYHEMVLNGDGREDSKNMFKTLSDRFRKTDPFAFASNARLFGTLASDMSLAFYEFAKNFSLKLGMIDKTRHHLRMSMSLFASTPL